MKDLKEAAEYDGYYEKIAPLYQQLEEQLKREKAADLQTHKQEICEYLASEIAVRYYYQKGRLIHDLSIDPDVATAKEILHDRNRYKSILNLK